MNGSPPKYLEPTALRLRALLAFAKGGLTSCTELGHEIGITRDHARRVVSYLYEVDYLIEGGKGVTYPNRDFNDVPAYSLSVDGMRYVHMANELMTPFIRSADRQLRIGGAATPDIGAHGFDAKQPVVHVRLIDQLGRGSVSAAELREATGITRTGINGALQTLQAHDMLNLTARGKATRYQLNASGSRLAIEWLQEWSVLFDGVTSNRDIRHAIRHDGPLPLECIKPPVLEDPTVRPVLDVPARATAGLEP